MHENQSCHCFSYGNNRPHQTAIRCACFKGHKMNENSQEHSSGIHHSFLNNCQKFVRQILSVKQSYSFRSLKWCSILLHEKQHVNREEEVLRIHVRTA